MNFEVSILPSWVVEEWNGRESNHFYSSCQVAWGFFNKFSKQTLLSSSFDSLRSLNVYMSLPRHLTCVFFILLLVMAICGAQGRAWSIRHTCITYIAKSKNRIQREKQVIQSDQDVHVHGLWWMEWKLLLYDLSPYINSFESMAISFFLSFFSWTFMCPYYFFLFFPIHGPSCAQIFFSR